MPVDRITSLAPAYLLLLGMALVLAFGPVLSPRRRHGLALAVSALATLSLLFINNDYPADAPLVRVLFRWLGEPALALRVPPFEPFLWTLMLSLLAISLAEWDIVDRLSPPRQAMFFALTALACSVVLTSTYHTLAFALLLFDGTAALFLLTSSGEPSAQGTGTRAVGRLLLGVLSSTTVVILAQGGGFPTIRGVDLGTLFALTVWLRLGLYPLVESHVTPVSPPPVRLGWTAVNLVVGLYLVSAGAAPWLAWLAGATATLHGVLAWLEPGREQALAHAGHALAVGILAIVAATGDATGAIAASISTVAALVTLGLTSPRLGRPDWTRPGRLWAYLPPLLATASLVGVPFTLGWGGRAVLYQAAWGTGLSGMLALVVVAEGAALSALYRYWRRLLRSAPAETRAWRPLGATLACVPLLIPALGPGLLPAVAPSVWLGPSPGMFPLSASLGLIGSLLWALFLGYGRRRLLDSLPFSRQVLISLLRLGWLLRGLGRVLDTMGLILLRARAVIEGEHYLAWAILLALGLSLVILVR